MALRPFFFTHIDKVYISSRNARMDLGLLLILKILKNFPGVINRDCTHTNSLNHSKNGGCRVILLNSSCICYKDNGPRAILACFFVKWEKSPACIYKDIDTRISSIPKP